MRASEPGLVITIPDMRSNPRDEARLLHPMIDGIEPHQSDNNEVDRDDKVQKSRHDENEDAGDERDQRRDMGGGDNHGFSSRLEWILASAKQRGRNGRDLNARDAVRFYATKAADSSL